MITGYNTDVRHRGLVFHVQTEDKGLSNPCVESLVYVGGQILTRKKMDYARMVRDGQGKDAIAALMEKQHRQTITEIRSGQLDADVAARLGPPPGPEPTVEVSQHHARAAADDESRSLDQVILDYLSTEAGQEHLILAMDSPDELQLGQEAVLAFHARSSAEDRAIEGAEIIVKLISTEAEPALLAEGATNVEGKLQLRIRIPDLRRGTAALIITAESSVGTAEIKHLI